MLKHIIILLLIVFVGCTHKPVPAPEHSSKTEIDPPTEDEDTPEPEVDSDTQSPIDKYLSSDNDDNEPAEPPAIEEPPPTEADALGIDETDLQLAKAIFKWKMSYDKGLWVECGKKYETSADIKSAAIEWAQAINAAHKTAHYKLRNGKKVQVSKQEAIGVMINESRFDRCAVGPNPRRFAYNKGILKRKNWHISHSLDELEKVFNHPLFRYRKADLGGGQIVVNVGKLTWEEIQNYLSVVPGVQIVFDEMRRRGEMYSTKTPSDRWPGSQKHSSYTLRALRHAKLIYKYM
jgi:hypothetical protein